MKRIIIIFLLHSFTIFAMESQHLSNNNENTAIIPINDEPNAQHLLMAIISSDIGQAADTSLKNNKPAPFTLHRLSRENNGLMSYRYFLTASLITIAEKQATIRYSITPDFFFKHRDTRNTTAITNTKTMPLNDWDFTELAFEDETITLSFKVCHKNDIPALPQTSYCSNPIFEVTNKQLPHQKYCYYQN